MRRIARPEEMEARTAHGVRELVVAAGSTFDDLAVELRRLDVDPGASAAVDAPGAGEYVVYVIGGGGMVRTGGEELPLGPESVIWLDPGERCEIVAGPDGLQALAAHAPG